LVTYSGNIEKETIESEIVTTNPRINEVPTVLAFQSNTVQTNAIEIDILTNSSHIVYGENTFVSIIDIDNQTGYKEVQLQNGIHQYTFDELDANVEYGFEFSIEFYIDSDENTIGITTSLDTLQGFSETTLDNSYQEIDIHHVVSHTTSTDANIEIIIFDPEGAFIESNSIFKYKESSDQD